MSSRLQELNFLERLKKTLQLIESSFENDEYVKKIVKSNKKENEKELLLIKHLNSNVVKKILNKKDLVKINKFFSFQYIEKNHVKINNLDYNLSNYNLLFFDNIYYKNKELLKLFISSKSDLTIWFKKFPKEFFIGFLKEYISKLFSLRENTGNSRFKNNIVSLNYYFVELYKYNFISFQELLLDKYNINCFISYEFVNNIAYYLSFDELQELILKIGTFSSEEKNLLVSNYIKVNPRKMSLNYFLDRLDRKMVLLNFEDESLCYQFIKRRYDLNELNIEDMVLFYINRQWTDKNYNLFIIQNINLINKVLINKIIFSNLVQLKYKLNILSKKNMNYLEYSKFLLLNASEDDIYNNLIKEKAYLKLSYRIFDQIFRSNNYSDSFKNKLLFDKKIFSFILIKKNINPKLINDKYNILNYLYSDNKFVNNIISFNFFCYEWNKKELKAIKELLKCQSSLNMLNKILDSNRVTVFKVVLNYFLLSYDNKTIYYVVLDKILRYFEDNNKYIYDINTEIDKETFLNIILRTQSIYKNVVLPNYVVDINNELNIEVKTCLLNYDKKRNIKCDQIFKKSISSHNYFLAKNAFLNRFFNINIEEAREFIRLFKNININDKKSDIYYESILSILNEFDINKLEKNYHQFSSLYTNMDNLLFYNDILKTINIEFRRKILDIDNDEHVETKKIKLNNKKIDVFIPKNDFYLLVHSTGAYNITNNRVLNYKTNWMNNELSFNNGISCSIISNTYFGITHVKEVLIGFKKWNDFNRIIMAPYDMYSNTYDLVTTLKRPAQYMYIKDYINNSRHTHNEFILERVDTSSNVKILPNYVVVFSSMNNQQKNKAISCSNDFGIPIVFIDDRKLLKQSKKEIYKKQKELKRMYSSDTLYEMLNLFGNIKNGLREHYSILSEKNFNEKKLEKELMCCYNLLLKKQNHDSISSFINVLENEKKKFNYTMLATKRINYFYFSSLLNNIKNEKVDFDSSIVGKINIFLKECNYDLKKNKYTNSDYLLLLNGVNKVKQYYQGRTRKHNINHIIRVIIYIQIISKLRDISSDDIKILIESALYHDIERINDMADKHHGLRAAESYLNTNGRNLKQRYIAFIIEFHEIADNQISINRLLSKYNLNVENYSRIMELACILKDADALDRVRFANPYATLNPSYLRFQESFSIITVAKSMCYFE